MGAIGLRPFAPDKEESVKEFVSRNLGSEAFERLIEPFCSGVYAGRVGALFTTLLSKSHSVDYSPVHVCNVPW